MGGVCSGGVKKKSEVATNLGISRKLRTVNSLGKQKQGPYPYGNKDNPENNFQRYSSPESRLQISCELKPSTPARTEARKVPQPSSFLGSSIEKAVEVLDTVGSSMATLNTNSGFMSTTGSKGNKISILAFEVANTTVRGSNLLQSLSEENVQLLQKEIFRSEGVKQLVSTDINELLRIAASDKREEFDVFSREVIRFGELCKDPQWHNLSRYISKLDSEPISDEQLRGETERTIQELNSLAQHTSELYHELHALDRLEQDYRQKLEEVESLNLPRRGESLSILQSELKHQRKLVRRLKKKSLWSKNLEEVMEKFVDVLTFIRQEILEIFGHNGVARVSKDPINSIQRLGEAGLALHYANIINQIDNIASRPTCLPPNIRDTLYQGLPISVKTALRSQLQTIDPKEELTIVQIKAEMEKTLQWLVPVAANTSKAHQGFGWVGEWANSGNEFGNKTVTCNNISRLETLHHADKQKTEQHILELVMWLHRLISQVRHRDNGVKPLPLRSPTRKVLILPSEMQQIPSPVHCYKELNLVKISQEDRNLLEEVKGRRLVPGISKSQEFVIVKKRGSKVWALSRSTGNSPSGVLGTTREFESHRNVLDAIDGLD